MLRLVKSRLGALFAHTSPASLLVDPVFDVAAVAIFEKLRSQQPRICLDRISAAAPFRCTLWPESTNQNTDIDSCFVWLFYTDKQQELDIPSLRIEETANDGRGTAVTKEAKKKDRGRHGSGTMSQIQGVKRPLYHTNSFTGEKLPKFGVETPHEEELERVGFFQLNFIIYCWKRDKFKVVLCNVPNDLSFVADARWHWQMGHWRIQYWRSFMQSSSDCSYLHNFPSK